MVDKGSSYYSIIIIIIIVMLQNIKIELALCSAKLNHVIMTWNLTLCPTHGSHPPALPPPPLVTIHIRLSANYGQ